ncbi:hypothetical protein [Fodinibius halophilus]|uniref:hypothetical protein n=1 Tax=Fodinibius halophilus TaxID=1736908 RepID=UPI00197AD4CA|nr:hypothetical protein [Fodinibius halophilus]
MKKLLIVTVLSAFLVVSLNNISAAQDADKDLGIGFIVGEPTGLSLKTWTGGGNAIDAGMAWSFGRYEAINIHADYLWHNYETFNEIDSGTLPIYYGIGGRVVLGDTDLIGARIPVGLNYLLEDSPIGFFFEVVPVINIAPETSFDVDGGIGVRLYL